MGEPVSIVEVGLRDGLQNESTPVDAAQRIEWFNRLAAAGLNRIEAGSFVSRKWVPQMADTDAVIAGIEPRDNLSVEVLVPNQRGLEAARACAGINTVALFTAASDAFTQRNINCSVAESLKRFEPLVRQAHEAGWRVRGYVSCIVGCPYEGRIEPGRVAEVCERLLELGVDEVSLGDTIGVARPREIRQVLDAVTPVVSLQQLALHCHDTYGQALANVLAGLEYGVRCFDSAVAGLGGCPYARGASGNLATEDLLYLLDGEGLESGVSLDRVLDVGRSVCEHLDRESPSRVARAMSSTA